jgi:ribonuclease R
LLKGVAERPDAEQIQTMLLRSMSQAVYSPDNIGHFGLAFTAYTHFTSPIRRYPDLIVHRLIKSQLAKDAKSFKVTGAQVYHHEQLAQLGEMCSATERNADMATREVVDWLKCEFMSAHIGSQYEGEVVAVTNFGMFVRIPEYHIDGLVHVTSLGQDYFHFDRASQRLVGESSGVVFQLGDKVKIEVANVDLEDRKIDFELIEAIGQSPRKVLSERERIYARAKRAKSGKQGLAGGTANRKQPTKSNSSKETKGSSKDDFSNKTSTKRKSKKKKIAGKSKKSPKSTKRDKTKANKPSSKKKKRNR